MRAAAVLHTVLQRLLLTVWHKCLVLCRRVVSLMQIHANHCLMQHPVQRHIAPSCSTASVQQAWRSHNLLCSWRRSACTRSAFSVSSPFADVPAGKQRQRYTSIVARGQQRPSDLRQIQEGDGSDGVNPAASNGEPTPAAPGEQPPNSAPEWQGQIQFSGGAGALKLPAGYTSSITSSPPLEGKAKGLPHRWRVVIMMAVGTVHVCRT